MSVGRCKVRVQRVIFIRPWGRRQSKYMVGIWFRQCVHLGGILGRPRFGVMNCMTVISYKQPTGEELHKQVKVGLAETQRSS